MSPGGAGQGAATSEPRSASSERAWGALFDWDGVIVDSSRLHFEAWNAVAREYGHPHERADFQRHFGSKNERAIRDVLAWTSDAKEVKAISERKEVLYRELLDAAGDVVLPGSRPFLQALAAAGVPRAVVSSSPRRNIETVLERSGLSPLFDAVIAADDVRESKPHPEGYCRGARALGLEPRRCVVFEDAHAGLEAGRAAGARTVAIATTHPAESLRADRVWPSLDVDRLPELEALVR